MPFTCGFIQHAAEHFGKPEIDGGKRTHDCATEKDVMKMRHDVIGVVYEFVNRVGGHHDPRQTPDDKHRDERDRKQHGRCKVNAASP